MEIKTAAVYLFAILHPGDSEIYYSITSTDMSDVAGYTMISSKGVSFTLPRHEEAAPAIIESLEKDREELQAKATAAVTAIDSTIANLMALEAPQ